MKITRSNYMYIYPKDSYEANVIRQILEARCIKDNPKYEKMKRTGRFQKGVSSKISTYKEENGMFKIYKGNYTVYKELLDSGLPLEALNDNRVSNRVEIESTVGPRDDEQRKAISNIYKWFTEGFGYGCLDAVPAAGKTFQAIKLASLVKEKTLVVVDMNLLIEQFIESILKFTDLKEDEIGFITGTNINYKDKKIIIATAQTLIKKKNIMSELEKEIGFLVVDEVHVASANTFQEIIPNFRPKYQLGLSGSHNRDDKMDFLVKESVGPIIHTITRENLLAAGSIITPTLRPIFLKDDKKFEFYNKNQEVDFRTVVDEYYNCKKVINKITNIVLYHYNDRSQLLICKEKTMIDNYYEAILKKLLGEEIIEQANKENQSRVASYRTLVEKLDKEDPLKFATKKDLKLLQFNNVTRSELVKKYTPKLEKEKERALNGLNKAFNMKWTDAQVVQEHEKTKSVKIITGDCSKDERNKIVEDANNGIVKILLATTTMDKAVSINRLDTLYLLFSTRERANTIQRIGRVGRSFEGKTDAIVYDIIYD